MEQSAHRWRNVLGLGPSASERILAKLERQNHALALQVERMRSMAQKTASGVPMSWGQFLYEENAELRGDKQHEVFEKMSYDPHVSSVLLEHSLPLLLAEWEVVPASEDERDVEVAEFVAANLLRKETDRFGPDYFCQTTWEQRLIEHLDMLRTGYSMHSKTVRKVNGKWVYDRIHWLEPSSVDPHGWVLEDDRLVRVERTFSDTQDRHYFAEPIEAEQVFLCVWGLKGARLAGSPFIRALYGPWYRKDWLVRWAMMAGQKFGNPMPYGYYPKGYDETSRDAFEVGVQAMRGTAPAEAFFVGPLGEDGQEPVLRYAELDGEVDRLRGLIDGENSEIAHGGGTRSKMAGETKYGTRSTAETHGASESNVRQAIGLLLCSYVNHGASNLPGLVEELVRWNYSTVTRFPKLKCRKVDPYEQDKLAEARAQAWEKGIIPKVAEARRQICEPLEIELPDEAYDVPEPAFPPPAASPPSAITPPEDNGTEEEPPGGRELEAVRLETLDEFRSRIAAWLRPEEEAPAGGGFRRATRLEARYIDLQAVAETYRTGERDVMTILRETRRGMVSELMGRFRSGKITPRNLDGQRRSKYRKQNRAVRDCLNVLEEVAEAGIEHVQAELKR